MLPVEVRFKPKKGYWVASAPALDVVTQGPTFEEAERNLREALMLFFSFCRERGTLETVLVEAGFTHYQIKEVLGAADDFVHPGGIETNQQCRV